MAVPCPIFVRSCFGGRSYRDGVRAARMYSSTPCLDVEAGRGGQSQGVSRHTVDAGAQLAWLHPCSSAQAVAGAGVQRAQMPFAALVFHRVWCLALTLSASSKSPLVQARQIAHPRATRASRRQFCDGRSAGASPILSAAALGRTRCRESPARLSAETGPGPAAAARQAASVPVCPLRRLPACCPRPFYGSPATPEGDRSACSALGKECRETRSASETIPPWATTNGPTFTAPSIARRTATHSTARCKSVQDGLGGPLSRLALSVADHARSRKSSRYCLASATSQRRVDVPAYCVSALRRPAQYRLRCPLPARLRL
ncbi:hypothetical protein DE146DRAFT_631671 [Phaeosphaeria sp. MPI-PUGE-AT-0046c]|nr:hypothetical protein DE146DRAFT_631671 [Phaeosphaeria sp. MPI-PUGE-AT-0046c]